MIIRRISEVPAPISYSFALPPQLLNRIFKAITVSAMDLNAIAGYLCGSLGGKENGGGGKLVQFSSLPPLFPSGPSAKRAAL